MGPGFVGWLSKYVYAMVVAVWNGAEDKKEKGMELAVRSQHSLCHPSIGQSSKNPRILNSNLVFVKIGGGNIFYLIFC